MEEFYFTIEKAANGEIVAKKSKFVATVVPTQNLTEALDCVAKVKRQNFSAKHNAFAFVLLDCERSSDDGEPSKTAGFPILSAIKAKKLKNVTLVVTRYFGGILLGTGGLRRAYLDAAKLAIDNSNVVKMMLCRKILIICTYSNFQKINAKLKNQKFKFNVNFLENVQIEAFVPANLCEIFLKDIKFLDPNSIKFQDLGEIYVQI